MSSFSSQTSLYGNKSTTSKLRTNAVTCNYVKPNDLLIDGLKILPIRNISESACINPHMKDYLHLKNTKLSDFDSYVWPTILRGVNLFAMPNKYVINTDSSKKEISSDDYLDQNRLAEKDTSLSYLCPLISKLMEKVETKQKNDLKQLETIGYIKDSRIKAQNGPLLLIVCGSCRNAQRIHELVTDIVEIIHRSRLKDHSIDKRLHIKRLKTIFIQGGGYEDTYDVPLTNGCDILICSTPFCLLRMLGHKKTNLERLEHLVLDEAYLLVERFYKQMSALMTCYAELLKSDSSQTVAQFVVFSTLWSTKLKSFLDKYTPTPVVISENKLEASFFGQTHHLVEECDADESIKMKQIVKCLKTCAREKKNTILFTNNDETAVQVKYVLSNQIGFANVSILIEQTNEFKTQDIEDKWANWESADKSHLIEKKLNTNLILVCSEKAAKFIRISNAKSVVHYDFPASKSSLANRLWYMREHFTGTKPVEKIHLNDSIDHGSNYDISSDNETIKFNLRNDTEYVIKDEDRLCSYTFISKEEKRFAESFLIFLRRIGYPEYKIPKELIKISHKNILKEEQAKFKYNLCPYIKSFGKCMEPNPSACKFRHRFDLIKDKLKDLCEDKLIPDEGYIKFKVSHVENTNHIYVNILSHQDLMREKTTDYDNFLSFDIELQMYFTNPSNIITNQGTFDITDIYAFKDITTALYKRVKLLQVTYRDAGMAYEVLAQCIDYGVKLIISVHDLIKLPPHLKKLPGQAVEVYFCDIRPIDRDLNYSTASKRFIAEKLAKSKEFVGKIQLAAGNTLWLHPVSSFKHLKEVKIAIIDDCVRSELVRNNFATNYQSHLRDLKTLFIESKMKISRQEDECFNLEMKCSSLFEHLFDRFSDNDQSSVAYAFLNKTQMNRVFVSSVETPVKFYVQNVFASRLLDRLNEDIRDFLNDLENEKKRKQFLTKENLKEEDKRKSEELCAFLKRIKHIQSNLSKEVIDLARNVYNKRLFCIAKLKVDNEHYRAEIFDFRTNGLDEEVYVFFVDYGDYCWTKITDVYPICDRFIRVLPFQAIQCSLDGIISISNEQLSSDESGTNNSLNLINNWTHDQGDKLWTATHNPDNIHHYLYTQIIEEYSNTNLKCFDLRQKSYLVRMFKKMDHLAVDIDISHELVTLNAVKLSKKEEKTIFTVKKEANPLGPLAKQSVVNFVRNQDETKQLEFIKLLELRSFMIRGMETEAMLATGLIQTIGQALFFISNQPISLLPLIKFIRKNFIHVDAYLNAFIENNGISHLIFILNETNDFSVEEYILNLFIECADCSLFRLKALTEPYLKTFFNHMISNCCDVSREAFIVHSISLLDKLSNGLDKQIYTNEIKKLVNKSIEKLSLKSNVNINDVNKFCDEYLKHVKIEDQVKSDSDDEKTRMKSEEERERVLRVCAFIQSTSTNEDIDKTDEFKLSTFGKKEPIYEGDLSPPNSSDEEIENQFLDDFSEMFFKAQQNNNIPVHESERLNPDYALFQNKPYKYPKIEWDQQKKQISLKLLLENVKEVTVDYKIKSVSFRTRLNETDYGFDFDLFDEIDSDKCRFVTRTSCLIIYLKKKAETEWPRLLTTFYKPKFIRSVYNNIRNTSSEEDENDDFAEKKIKKKKKKNFDLSKLFSDKAPVKHTGRIKLSSTESSKSDSESDFDGKQYNDLAESRDIFWD